MKRIKTKGKCFLALAVMVTICLMSVQVMAGSDIAAGVSTGKRRIINDNVSQAKKNAISDALDLAVHNAFISLLSRDVLARNMGFLYDRILVDTAKYITNYKVLAELRQYDYYLVAVESKVDISLLEKVLMDNNIINANREIPTMLLLISEKTEDEVLPRYWWGNNPLPYESVSEELLIQLMGNYQILSAASNIYRPEPSFYNIVFKSIYDLESAIALGSQMKADLVAIGSARSMEAPNKMGEEKTYMAAVELDVYSVGTREKIASTRIQETVASGEQAIGNHDALIKAARSAGEDIMPRINQFWVDYLRKERTIEVMIQGDHFLPRFVALKQKFKEMSEIENILPREIGTNSALVGVLYKGKVEQFANALVLKSFDSFGIEISDLTETSLTIRFVSQSDESGTDQKIPENSEPIDNENKDGQ